MIYSKTETGQHVIIIEPGNIERLKLGKVMKTPDNEVIVAFAPDMEWTSNQLRTVMTLTNEVEIETLERILVEGLNRPEVTR
jgi:hypothetical protein